MYEKGKSLISIVLLLTPFLPYVVIYNFIQVIYI